MKKSLFILLLPLMLLVNGCVGTLDQLSHKGGSTLFVSPIVFDAIEHQYAVPAKSKHFKLNKAGFIVQASRTRKLAVNEVVALIDMDLIKPFKQDVYQEVIFENPHKATAPIIFSGKFNLNNERSILISHHLKNLQLDQDYKVEINFYADEAKTKLVETISQTMRSPYDTKGGCLKSNLPKEILFKIGLFDLPTSCAKI